MLITKKEAFSMQFLQIVDAVLIFIAIFGAALLWNFISPFMVSLEWFRITLRYYEGVHRIPSFVWAIVPFGPLVLEMFGFYKKQYRRSIWKAVMPLFQSAIVIILALSFITFILRSPALHRPFFLIFPAMCCSLLLLREQILQLYFKYQGADDSRRMSVVLVGGEGSMEEWEKSLQQEERESMHIVDRVDLKEDRLQDLKNLLTNEPIERAIFLVRDIPFNVVTGAVEECEIQGVEAWIAADFVRARIAQPTFDSMNGQSMLVLRSTPSLSWAVLIKAIMDRFLAFILLIGTSPIWLFVYIGIQRQSPGPVLYRQERAGKYGKPFRIWKFRSMIMDADKKLEELKKEAGNEMSGPVFKLDDDPRIFPFGHFIRKYSIDELPQLINVLVGEMSLVGPRPMATYELPEIEKSEHRRKLSVQPGITCIWQVSGRNEITNFDDWVKLDLQYIDNWSLWLDIKLLFMTVPAVLFAKGSK